MTTLSSNFGYVAATAAASFVVHHIYMGFKVGKARKQYNIDYPDLYATAENCPNEANRKKFNCVQRAHQNSLENQPIFLALLTISGLQHPVTAASLGAAVLVGRIGYFEGYACGDPKKRGNPIYFAGMLGMLGLLGTTIKVAVDLINSK
jgi:glutathione S-transferase